MRLVPAWGMLAPESDGKFSLGHLKPGRYSVQFTSRAGFVRGKPQIIELKVGDRRTGVILLSQLKAAHLQPRFKRLPQRRRAPERPWLRDSR